MRTGLIVVAACAACATAVPSTTDRPAGGKPASYAGMHGIPGEAMEYRVSFRGMSVATVQVAVGRIGWLDEIDPRPPQRAWHGPQATPHHRALQIVSRGHTVGLMTLLGDIDWSLETMLDLDAGRGVQSVEEATIVLAGERDHDKQTRRWGSGDVFDDLHSAAAKFRAWNPRAGERLRLEVHIDRAHLRVEAWPAGREVISAPRPMPAIRYEGIAAEKARFAVWLSDDAARVPLRLRAESKWGSIAVDLVEYEPPAELR
jgi:hypothetical protein